MADHVIFEGSPSPCGDCHAWCARTKYKVTSTYIEKESGLCCRTVDNLQLIRITDIHYDTKCCCCGQIVITSTDITDPTLTMRGLPNGREVYAAIRDAWDKAANKKVTVEI